jgi:large subunit ribosomal protein L9
MVEVILKTDMKDLGQAGDLVHVKPGYARNYLIPNGLAFLATPGARKRYEEEQRRVVRTQERAKSDAQDLATELEGLSLTFTAKAGEEGRLYGSVTTADIAEALAKEGLDVDKRIIHLDEPIKELGVFAVPIRLHAEVEPEVKVWVVAEE